jgi:hypothetical protein
MAPKYLYTSGVESLTNGTRNSRILSCFRETGNQAMGLSGEEWLIKEERTDPRSVLSLFHPYFESSYDVMTVLV